MKRSWLISLVVAVLLMCCAPALWAEANPAADPAGYNQSTIRRSSKTKSSRNGIYKARANKSSSYGKSSRSRNSSGRNYSATTKRSAGGGHSSRGLYSTSTKYKEQGISLSLDMLYSYDDIDATGVSTRILSNWTGGGSFSYYVAMTQGVNFRATLGSGYIHGDYPNQSDGTGKASFWTVYGELDAGVEWYPWLDYGFYVYGGIGCMMNAVRYTYGGNDEKPINWLPVVPLEIGYNFDIDENWRIGVHLGGHIGLIDTRTSNLDGYPNKYTVAKPSSNKTPDGYLTFGINFIYRWGK